MGIMAGNIFNTRDYGSKNYPGLFPGFLTEVRRELAQQEPLLPDKAGFHPNHRVQG
jgi:hypothetical protein